MSNFLSHCLHLFILVVICMLVVNVAQIEKNPEREFLLDFKNSLENPENLTSWLPFQPHCSWKGVLCKNGTVVSLALPSLLLKGTLSPFLFYLQNLRLLDLSYNRISGQIPPEIENLKNLESLHLSTNKLTGKIPFQLGLLNNLITLDLSGNNLYGVLFSSLFTDFKSLVSLDLSQNSFHGRIPSSIGSLTSLKHLDIGHNRFSGVLPTEIGNLTSLRILSSPSCSLSGPLPYSISHLRSLEYLDFSHNPLNSSIPSSIGELQNLSTLYLEGAHLNGSIPSELGNCTSLKYLDISFNSLSGSIPTELSTLSLLSFVAAKNQLSGTLPSWLRNWTEIHTLLLSENRFTGKIPSEIGNCSSLHRIDLRSNLLNGSVPSEICDPMSMVVIDLSDNFLFGSIENTFRNCRNLTLLKLSMNKLSGSIPEYLSELQLSILDLDSNNFIGVLPITLWDSIGLFFFSASENFLHGSLPAEIGRAVGLQWLSVNNNQLTGTLPKEIGKLKVLSVFSLNSNALEGVIPVEVFDCVSLNTLDLGNNRFNGSIPEKLVDLASLQVLVLSHNDFIGSIPAKVPSYFHKANNPEYNFLQHHGVFDLSYNKLSGNIPIELGHCSLLVYVWINNNRISGEIPRSLFRLIHLITLDMSANSLTGFIPNDLGHLVNLQGLNLANNQLRGTIPSSIGHMHSLVRLNLSANTLSGSIPIGIGNLVSLTQLDLSFNDLIGELPTTLGGLVELGGLYVQENNLSGSLSSLFSSSTAGWLIQFINMSRNSFSGELPKSLGDFLSLSYLDLHANKLEGVIPPDLGNLIQLQHIDFSGNKLSGGIPKSLCDLSDIEYCGLADNRLEGPIPRSGICYNSTKLALSGNKDLCGEILGLSCVLKIKKRRPMLSHGGIAGICIAGICIGIIFIVIYGMRKKYKHNNKEHDPSEANDRLNYSVSDRPSTSRTDEPLSINLAMCEQEQILRRLPFHSIVQATDSFSNSNIIGEGGYATVYRGVLERKHVAVKRLNDAGSRIHSDFEAEMKTLGKLKHPNLVKLVAYSSTPTDKILVYEYMVNGSLEDKLKDLDWPTRLKVARGVARGLTYIHAGFFPHIIHRDIKLSNILLDEDFEPKLGDFGFARLISDYDTHVNTHLAGTIGYIPPEYGQGSKVTISGDVYSFGVILLELVTGMKPVSCDYEEKNAENLVDWVCQKISKGEVDDVFDASAVNESSKPQMRQMVEIAVKCLCCNPKDRLIMPVVQNLLDGIDEE